MRPVLDQCELNEYVDTHTADADVCVQKLSEWRQRGSNVSILDLWKGYLQVHIHKSLWPHQMAIFKGHRYCVTRREFGLNMVPAIMKSIIQKAMSENTGDKYVNESIASAACIQHHLVDM